jgi:hypothetical protein
VLRRSPSDADDSAAREPPTRPPVPTRETPNAVRVLHVSASGCHGRGAAGARSARKGGEVQAQRPPRKAVSAACMNSNIHLLLRPFSSGNTSKLVRSAGRQACARLLRVRRYPRKPVYAARAADVARIKRMQVRKHA